MSANLRYTILALPLVAVIESAYACTRSSGSQFNSIRLYVNPSNTMQTTMLLSRNNVVSKQLLNIKKAQKQREVFMLLSVVWVIAMKNIDDERNIREIADYSSKDTLTDVLECIKGESK